MPVTVYRYDDAGVIALTGDGEGYTPYLVDDSDFIYVKTKQHRIEAWL